MASIHSNMFGSSKAHFGAESLSYHVAAVRSVTRRGTHLSEIQFSRVENGENSPQFTVLLEDLTFECV